MTHENQNQNHENTQLHTDVEQRSAEWFAARRGRLTASDCGAVLGLDPNRTRDDVMRAMVREWHGAEREFQGNIATQWGVANEANAIAAFELDTGLTVQPCGFYTYEDWLGASPDGITTCKDGTIASIEVKCPFANRNSETIEQFKHIEEQMHYYTQMQIQMLCAKTEKCFFVRWSIKACFIERVDPCTKWLSKNLPILKAFHDEYLIEREKPEKYLEPKRKIIDTPQARKMVQEYDDLTDAIEAATNRRKDLLAEMATIAKNTNAEFAGRNLTLVKREGGIKYAEAVKYLAPNANLEPWRGKPSEYWVLK